MISGSSSPCFSPLLSVPDLYIIQPCLPVLLDIDVDGVMGIDISHFVLEALGDAYYEVAYECFDCSESCDILPGAVVDFDGDLRLGGKREADCKMRKVFCQFACNWKRISRCTVTPAMTRII